MAKKIKKKGLTWAELKTLANKLSPELLKKEVCLWGEESGAVIDGVQILKEDYVHDGDMGCAPLSVMKQSMTKEEWEEDKDEYYPIHKKGTVILWVDRSIQ